MFDPFQGSGAPLTNTGFQTALAQLGNDCDAPLLWSILLVETRGFGFQQDKRLKVLFERHVFHKRTNGQFDRVAPDISSAVPGGYVGGAGEYDRVRRAAALDPKAALESASWGLGQTMGFNATAIGYESAAAMVAAYNSGEDQQLLGCSKFITANSSLLAALRQQNWDRVAFFYNGKDYAQHNYNINLAKAFKQCSTALPDIDWRAMQARLAYAGFDPHGIDGVRGPSTIAALRSFMVSRNLIPSDNPDASVLAALQKAAGI